MSNNIICNSCNKEIQQGDIVNNEKAFRCFAINKGCYHKECFNNVVSAATQKNIKYKTPITRLCNNTQDGSSNSSICTRCIG